MQTVKIPLSLRWTDRLTVRVNCAHDEVECPGGREQAFEDNTRISLATPAKMSEAISRNISQRSFAIAALAAIGGIWLASKACSLASFTNLHFLRRSSLERYKNNPRGKPSTSWALVTGASDGIGRGFAEELCHRGFNLILHGRNEQKLNNVRSELLKQWPDREIEIFVFDATGDISDLGEAIHQLSDLNIRVLVNNVGAGQRPFWVPFANQGENIQRLITVDGIFTTEITRALLPSLTDRSPGLIINIGSFASDAPCPYVSVLSGVKAYNKAWSRSLNFEMIAEGHDVEVMHILVGMVATVSVHLIQLPAISGMFVDTLGNSRTRVELRVSACLVQDKWLAALYIK